jgi:hypothetical protein
MLPRARTAAEPKKKARDARPFELDRGFVRPKLEVLVGKSTSGTINLSASLARSRITGSLHGAAARTSCLRRRKARTSRARRRLEEVAAGPRSTPSPPCGTVPVTVTQKKYVSKPRKAPPAWRT